MCMKRYANVKENAIGLRGLIICIKRYGNVMENSIGLKRVNHLYQTLWKIPLV